MKHEAKVIPDLPGKTVTVTRDFDAPPEKVWRAFTEPEILDQWWAPKPYWIETKTLELKPGGIWHFSMNVSASERHWWRVDYITIDPQHSITSTSGPSDENGNLNHDFPRMERLTEFIATPTGTMVRITIKFDNEDHIQYMLEGGLITGTAAAFNTLDELLEIF